MAAVIEVSDLVVRYGDVTAVDHLSFSCPPGEVTAILGVNGAGKTSTISILEGLRRPSEGTARVLDLDPWTDRDTLTQRIGVMPQDPGLPPSGRPADLVRLYGALRGISVDVDAVVHAAGLTDRARSTIRRLSGGERQRLSFALAMLGESQVVFLDEPTAGVDIHGRAMIREAVAERVARGTAVVLTTHELDEARRMAHRVVIIDNGRLVAAGTVDELAQSAADDRPRLRFSAATGLDVIGLSDAVGGHVAEEAAGEYVADVDPSPVAIAALTTWLAERNVTLDQLDSGRVGLEEIFSRLTGGAATGDGEAT